MQRLRNFLRSSFFGEAASPNCVPFSPLQLTPQSPSDADADDADERSSLLVFGAHSSLQRAVSAVAVHRALLVATFAAGTLLFMAVGLLRAAFDRPHRIAPTIHDEVAALQAAASAALLSYAVDRQSAAFSRSDFCVGRLLVEWRAIVAIGKSSRLRRVVASAGYWKTLNHCVLFALRNHILHAHTQEFWVEERRAARSKISIEFWKGAAAAANQRAPFAKVTVRRAADFEVFAGAAAVRIVWRAAVGLRENAPRNSPIAASQPAVLVRSVDVWNDASVLRLLREMAPHEALGVVVFVRTAKPKAAPLKEATLAALDRCAKPIFVLWNDVTAGRWPAGVDDCSVETRVSVDFRRSLARIEGGPLANFAASVAGVDEDAVILLTARIDAPNASSGCNVSASASAFLLEFLRAAQMRREKPRFTLAFYWLAADEYGGAGREAALQAAAAESSSGKRRTIRWSLDIQSLATAGDAPVVVFSHAGDAFSCGVEPWLRRAFSAHFSASIAVENVALKGSSSIADDDHSEAKLLRNSKGARLSLRANEASSAAQAASSLIHEFHASTEKIIAAHSEANFVRASACLLAFLEGILYENEAPAVAAEIAPQDSSSSDT